MNETKIIFGITSVVTTSGDSQIVLFGEEIKLVAFYNPQERISSTLEVLQSNQIKSEKSAVLRTVSVLLNTPRSAKGI